MKINLIIILSVIGLSFTACSGDHSDHNVGDTANHTSVPANSATKSTDTSKVTTATGDATTVDNSGSGGTKIAKDTAASKMKSGANKK
jgi:hypothetical protein